MEPKKRNILTVNSQIIFISAMVFCSTIGFSQISFTVSNSAGSYSITCTNTVLNLSASSNYSAPVSYIWTNSQTVTISNSLSINNPCSLTLTAGSGSITSSQTLAIGINTTAPSLTLTSTSNILSCTIYSFQLHAISTTTNLSYTWQVGSPFDECSGPYCQGFSAGNPKVIVKDLTNGCVSSATLHIADQRIYPVLSASPVSSISCPGGTVSLFSSPSNTFNISFKWEGPVGALMSGTNTPILNTDSPGDYKVTATDTVNGCTSLAYVSVYACVGIDEKNKNLALMELFPNPVKDRLHLKFIGLEIQDLKLTITNMLGQTFYALSEIDTKQVIDISSFEPGVYFLNVQSGSEWKNFKIIKE